jgi:hypothetical protein
MTEYLIITCVALAVVALYANMLPYHRIVQRNLSIQRARQSSTSSTADGQLFSSSLSSLHQALGHATQDADNSVENFPPVTALQG